MNTHDHHHFFRARMVVVEQAGSSCRRSRHGRRSSSVAPQSSSTGMLKQKTECKAKFRKQIKTMEMVVMWTCQQQKNMTVNLTNKLPKKASQGATEFVAYAVKRSW
jgi:hypothetical protein